MTGREARNAYMRKYRAENKERLREQDRQRRRANPERYQKYALDYWERKAKEFEGFET